MIHNLRLQNFRSYVDDSLEFGEGVNIIVGPNASGKTNLLEALLVSCVGSSFRVKDADLVAFEAPWARLDAQDEKSPRTVKLIRSDSSSMRKEFVVNDQKFVRMSLQKSIPVVLFEPNHLSLLHGSPERRRDYLDNLLEQTTAGYAKARRDYKRILAQRNALLKKGLIDQLFAWNIRLSEVGAVLAEKRFDLVSKLNAEIKDLYTYLSQSGDEEVSVGYQTPFGNEQYSSSLLRALEQRQAVDTERGFTTVGPHRDDMIVAFNGRNVSDVASRGETRSILLALKILELRIIEEVRGEKPILLLDDVFSELDGKRRKALTEVISGYQTFLTTTDADIVVQHFMDNCLIIPLG